MAAPSLSPLPPLLDLRVSRRRAGTQPAVMRAERARSRARELRSANRHLRLRADEAVLRAVRLSRCEPTPRAGRCEHAVGAPRELIEVQTKATVEASGALRRFARAALELLDCDEPYCTDVLLAIGEACANVVLHAYVDADDAVVRALGLGLGRRGDHIEVSVRDRGSGISPRADSPGAGLGLALIKAVAERVEITSGTHGAEIRMAFSCPAVGM
jgi:serine/threonine-protein kinase RsbW